MLKSIFKIMFLAFFALFSLQLNSQTNGRFSFSAGVGFAPTSLDNNVTENSLPVNLMLRYQVSPMFSLSGYAGYASSAGISPFVVTDGRSAMVENKQYLFGLRGELRKEISGKFEMYGGGLLGYNHTSIREYDALSKQTISRDADGPTPFDPNQSNGKFLYSGFVGSTYYLHPSVGVFAEVGYGISLLNTGLTIRL